MPDPLLEAVLRNAYGQGNINLFSRPTTVNADGSHSSLFSMGGEDDQGNEVVFPGVDAHGGGIIPQDKAWQQYQDTGKYLGKFKVDPANPKAAYDAGDALGEKLHQDAANGYYSVPLATSHKSVDQDQLMKVLHTLIYGPPQ